MRRDIAHKYGVSEKTIDRYLEKFHENSFDGLKPGKGGRPGPIAIDQKIIMEAMRLKRENPNRGVGKIISCFELEGIIEEGSVKRSTLQKHLEKNYCSRIFLQHLHDPNASGGERFGYSHRCELWQGDTKHGIYIGGKKTYLISFIDDFSRLITHSEFYYSESVEHVADCLHKAISKYGIPDKIYLDNGKPYVSNSLVRSCALLNIQKLHTKVNSAKSKGKIEKYHQLVDRFFEELKLDKVDTIEQLNIKWQQFLEIFYQTYQHSALDNKTPRETFERDTKAIVLADEAVLDEAFLLVNFNRKIDKSGCVSFKGEKYTGEGLINFIGKTVELLYNFTDPPTVWAKIFNLPKIELKKLVIKNWVPARPKLTESPIISDISAGSRFLDAAEKEVLKRESERIAGLYGPDREIITDGSRTYERVPNNLVIPESNSNLSTNRELVKSDNNLNDNKNTPQKPYGIKFIAINNPDNSIDNNKDSIRRGISFLSFKKYADDEKNDKGEE
jgi:transposase InsO family protein